MMRCLIVLLGLLLAACQQFPGPATPAVVLDIGHSAEYPGARTPGKVDGKRFSGGVTEAELKNWIDSMN